MNVVKADVMDLARAMRIEVDGSEPVRLVFARCIEHARELAAPVQLYGTRRMPPAVRDWARLALLDLDSFVSGFSDSPDPGHSRAYGYLRALCMQAAELARPSSRPPVDSEKPPQQRAEEWAATQGRRRERSA
jgi:hypothetical protein